MFLPHRYVAKITDLCPTELRQQGLDGLLLDIDGTLRDYGNTTFPSDVLAWIAAAKSAGLSICLYSNGIARKVAAAADELGIPYVAKAYKPFPFRCRRALAALQLPAERVALIGDQLFADVLAGRLAGLHTILVDPTSYVEPWFTRIKRPLEIPLRRRLTRTPSPRAAHS